MGSLPSGRRHPRDLTGKVKHCTCYIVSYIPSDCWASGLFSENDYFKTLSTRQSQYYIANSMDDLVKRGYLETRTITRNQEVMSVFWHEDFGWRIIATDIPAPR